jgi:hypothetical protein
MNDTPPSADAAGLATKRPLFARAPGWQLSAMLVLEVLFLFGAVPALSEGEADRSVANVLQLALAVIVIGLIARSTWLRLVLLASFGLALAVRLLPGLLPQATALGLSLVYNLLATAETARAVFGPGDVNHHRIAGAVFIYLNIALIFGLVFIALNIADPGAIAGVEPRFPISDMIHLSLSALTTLGDAHLAAKSPLAISLTDLEAIIGQLFPAILLSRLVGLHLTRER